MVLSGGGGSLDQHERHYDYSYNGITYNDFTYNDTILISLNTGDITQNGITYNTNKGNITYMLLTKF